MQSLHYEGNIDEFSRLHWHDSRMFGLHVVRDESGRDIVSIHVKFDPLAADTVIEFVDVRGVVADIDLLGKRLCGDQIAAAHCEVAEGSSADILMRLNDRFDLYPDATTDNLLVFVVDLIHPGGRISVVAKSLRIR